MRKFAVACAVLVLVAAPVTAAPLLRVGGRLVATIGKGGVTYYDSTGAEWATVVFYDQYIGLGA